MLRLFYEIDDMLREEDVTESHCDGLAHLTPQAGVGENKCCK